MSESWTAQRWDPGNWAEMVRSIDTHRIELKVWEGKIFVWRILVRGRRTFQDRPGEEGGQESGKGRCNTWPADLIRIRFQKTEPHLESSRISEFKLQQGKRSWFRLIKREGEAGDQ